MNTVVKLKNPIDAHIGSRIRMARLARGMTQEKLANKLKLTFQQVQKYEKGTNRVGGSRMHEIATILSVPVSFFYEGTSEVNPSDLNLNAIAATTTGIRMVRHWANLTTDQHMALLKLAELFAEANAAAVSHGSGAGSGRKRA